MGAQQQGMNRYMVRAAGEGGLRLFCVYAPNEAAARRCLEERGLRVDTVIEVPPAPS